MKTIKIEIKELAENQKVLKNQRKTVHLQGERLMESWKAEYLHRESRHKLRLLYATYAILKGKTIEQFDIENPSKDKTNSIVNYRNEIEKLVEKYERTEEVICVD